MTWNLRWKLLTSSRFCGLHFKLESFQDTRPSRGGGIGRRKGLKIPRGKPRAGSIPALGTRLREK